MYRIINSNVFSKVFSLVNSMECHEHKKARKGDQIGRNSGLTTNRQTDLGTSAGLELRSSQIKISTEFIIDFQLISLLIY